MESLNKIGQVLDTTVKGIRVIGIVALAVAITKEFKEGK